MLRWAFPCGCFSSLAIELLESDVIRKIILLGATLGLLALWSGAALADSGNPQVTAARRAIDAGNRRYLAALEQADAAACASVYAVDGIQMPSSGRSMTVGRATIAAQTAQDLKDTKYIGGSIATTNVAVFRDLAYETGRYTFTYREKGKQAAVAVGRYFVVWQRQPDGSYLIKVDSGFPQVCPH